MSNRFHNKFHRHNHHTTPTDRNSKYPDSAYDPIASPEAPFRGEFYVDGNITTLSSVSALGDLYASNGTFHKDVTIEGNLNVLGTTTQLDTFVHVTSAVDITNAGSGPALKVTQTGSQDIATFYDDSATALIIKDGGNVGIGTNAPGAKLTVSGTLSTSSTVEFPNIGLGEDNSVVILNSSGFLKTDEINPAVWDTTAKFISASNINLTTGYITKAGNLFGVQDSVIFDNGTNVGIGTNAPGAKLTVSGTLSTSGTATIGTIDTGGTGTSFVVENNGLLQKRTLNIAATDTTNRFVSAFDADLTVNYLTKAKNSNGIDESIVYDDGTTVTVKGSLSSTGNFTSNGTATIGTIDTGGTGTSFVVENNGLLQKRTLNIAATDTTNRFVSAFDADLTVNYLTKAINSNGINESIVYDDGTNVGIGTNAPGAKLTVSGTLSTSGTATIGTIDTGGTGTSFVVENNGLLQKRTLNIAATDTTNRFVSAFDGALSVNYLTKAKNSNGIDESIVYDDGTTVTVKGSLSSTGNFTSNGTATIGNIADGTTDSVIIESSGTLQKRTIDSRIWGSSLVDGTGTTNYVAKWSDTNTVTNSIIFDNGTTVTAKGALSSTGNFTSNGTATIGTIETGTGTSIIVENNGLLQKRALNIAATDTTSRFVSASDGDLTVNYLTKAINSNGINESIVYDDGTTVTAKGALSSTGNFTSNGTATIGTIETGTGTSIIVENNGLLQKRTLNAAAFDTTNRSVSASDGDLTVNYLTKAINSNGINESIVYDDGTTVTAKGALSSTGNFTSNGTATIGTIETGTGTSFVVENNGLLQKRTLNIAVTNTTSRFVSASDADLSVNYLTKAKNSNGIDESIVYDDGTTVTAKGALSSTGHFTSNGTATIGTIETGTGTYFVVLGTNNVLEKRTIDPTALNPGATYQPIITGAATTIVSSDLTQSKALVSDESGKVAASTVTSTELEYLNGVTSAIQNQLDGKQANLSFTPVQQGGGAEQGSNKLYIGWSSADKLKLQIDSTNFGADWPINITGMLKPGTLRVIPQSTTTLPQSNDVEFVGHGAEVTITSFNGGVRGVTYTLTNCSTHAVTLSTSANLFVRSTSANLFVRGENSWNSHKCTQGYTGTGITDENSWNSHKCTTSTEGYSTTSTEGYIVLPQNFSCSLRMKDPTTGSAW